MLIIVQPLQISPVSVIHLCRRIRFWQINTVWRTLGSYGVSQSQKEPTQFNCPFFCEEQKGVFYSNLHNYSSKIWSWLANGGIQRKERGINIGCKHLLQLWHCSIKKSFQGDHSPEEGLTLLGSYLKCLAVHPVIRPSCHPLSSTLSSIHPLYVILFLLSDWKILDRWKQGPTLNKVQLTV